VKPEEVSLVIDVFKPSTLPMSRLADYLKPFSVMLGSEAHVHFEGVADGSAASVEPHAAPKVRERINGVVAGSAPAETPWAKVKFDRFDRQIVAIAIVSGASEIISDDPDVKNIGERWGIGVTSVEDLEIPAELVLPPLLAALEEADHETQNQDDEERPIP